MTDRLRGLLAGVGTSDEAELGRESSCGISGSGFLVFVLGNAGRGPDGGAVCGGGGLDGRCGIADVIVAVTDVDIVSHALIPLRASAPRSLQPTPAGSNHVCGAEIVQSGHE